MNSTDVPSLAMTTPASSSLTAMTQTMRLVYLCVATPILSFGLVTNLLTMAVMNTRRMKTLSSSIYLTAVAVADTCIVMETILSDYLDELGVQLQRKLAFFNDNDLLCKLERVTSTTFFTWAAWMIVTVTAERFVVMLFPLRARALCTRRTACIVVALMTSFHVVLWVSISLQFGVSLGPCDLSQYYYFMETAGGFLTIAVMHTFIPVVILFTLNTGIVIQLRRAQRNRSALVISNVKGKPQGNSGSEVIKDNGKAQGNSGSDVIKDGRKPQEIPDRDIISGDHQPQEKIPNEIIKSDGKPQETPQNDVTDPPRVAVGSKKESMELRATRLVMSVSTVYLVLCLPATMAMCVMYLGAASPAGLVILRPVLELSVMFNHCINFVVYGVASQQFRSALGDLFGCNSKA